MLNMKCGILLLVVLLVEVQHAYTTGKHFSKEKEEQSKLLRRHYNECMEETRVSPNIVHRIRHGDWSHSDAPPAHEWALCVLVKSGLMTKEGVYKMDKPFSEIATEEKRRVEKLVDKCLPTKAYPSPVIAYKFMRCFSSKKTPYLETVAALIRDH